MWEFTSPLKIDACIERLKGIQQPHAFLRKGLDVEFFQLDANTYEFVVTKKTRVQLRGRLINEYDLTTHVEGFASLTPNVIVRDVGAILVCILFICSVLNTTNHDVGGTLLTFIVLPITAAVTIYYDRRQSRRLADEIKILLEAAE